MAGYGAEVTVSTHRLPIGTPAGIAEQRPRPVAGGLCTQTMEHWMVASSLSIRIKKRSWARERTHNFVHIKKTSIFSFGSIRFYYAKKVFKVFP
jgi:hypothetical protein